MISLVRLLSSGNPDLFHWHSSQTSVNEIQLCELEVEKSVGFAVTVNIYHNELLITVPDLLNINKQQGDSQFQNVLNIKGALKDFPPAANQEVITFKNRPSVQLCSHSHLTSLRFTTHSGW